MELSNIFYVFYDGYEGGLRWFGVICGGFRGGLRFGVVCGGLR